LLPPFIRVRFYHRRSYPVNVGNLPLRLIYIFLIPLFEPDTDAPNGEIDQEREDQGREHFRQSYGEQKDRKSKFLHRKHSQNKGCKKSYNEGNSNSHKIDEVTSYGKHLAVISEEISDEKINEWEQGKAGGRKCIQQKSRTNSRHTARIASTIHGNTNDRGDDEIGDCSKRLDPG
jgi:hypothetical protein